MTRLRTFAVVLGFLLVQLVLLPDVRLGTVRGDAFVALAIAGGLVGGPERGAGIGFVGGFAADLFLETPFGLTALVLSVVGFAVGMLQSLIIRSAWWIPAITAFWASVTGVLLYALLGAIVGQDQFLRPDLVVTAAIVGAVNAVLAPFLVAAADWAVTAGPEGA